MPAVSAKTFTTASMCSRLQWQPLRARRGDLLPLAQHLLALHARKMHKGNIGLDESARDRILGYDWPGNIRELDNALQRALILQTGQNVSAQDLGSGWRTPDRLRSPAGRNRNGRALRLSTNRIGSVEAGRRRRRRHSSRPQAP